MSVRTEKMFLNIFFLLMGLILSLVTYTLVLGTTDNPIIAIISMTVVLAFWVGALTVSVRIRF